MCPIVNHTEATAVELGIASAGSPVLNPSQNRVLQNKADQYGKKAYLSNILIQPKLTVGSPDDPYEREADFVADRVMRMPAPNFVQRKCAECEKEEELQRKPLDQTFSPFVQTKAENTVSDGLADSIHSSRGSGSVLDADTNTFMSHRFGYDFHSVKIHDDSQSAQINRSLNARAFTVGNDIYFNQGQYRPDSSDGKHLLAHELTHVVQQKNTQGVTLQRQLGSPQQIDYVDQRDGAPNASTCGAPSNCPTTFCQPYRSENLARSQRSKMMLILMAGIAAFVDSRVVPLWNTYLMGGSPPKNLTSEFGADFAASPTTLSTTRFLTEALKTKLTAARPSFPTGINVKTVNLEDIIGTEIAAINTAGDVNEMNFDFPDDIAGNIAGGIGDNQTACKSGAQPSPFNDERLASGIATIVRDTGGNLTVFPVINYTVKDTIDLCPGNCGTSREQIATVPMSQFEATGISGDVPFTISFSSVPPPFNIPHP